MSAESSVDVDHVVHWNLDIDGKAPESGHAAGDPHVTATPPEEAIWSPTFSAATVSSGGLTTPLRLSGAYQRNTIDESVDPFQTTEIDNVTENLRRLDSGGGTLLLERRQDASRPKTDSSFQQPLLSSNIAAQGTKTDSFADDIFSELGYLGASIA